MEGRTLGRRVACCGFCLSLLVASASGLLAQSDPDHENQISARGFSPEKLYNVADLDAINLFNGNLTLTIPIGQTYPVGPGLSYQLTLVYNSLVWDLQETYRPPTNSFDTRFWSRWTSRSIRAPAWPRDLATPPSSPPISRTTSWGA